MSKRIIPTLAMTGALALAGCSALDTQAEAERVTAEARLISAQARADEAQARLISAQAMSATLATQAGQVERLAGEVAEQSQAARLVALTLAGALFVLLAGGVVIVALALRRPTVTLTLPPVPELDHLADWPEYRAMYRAMLAEAMQREVERRRALIAARQERER